MLASLLLLLCRLPALLGAQDVPHHQPSLGLDRRIQQADAGDVFPQNVPEFQLPHTMAAFPNIDFCNFEGFKEYAGMNTEVNVWRGVGGDEIKIGSTKGVFDDGGIMEVNHPGYPCWGEGLEPGSPYDVTPDLMPGDYLELKVTAPGDVPLVHYMSRIMDVEVTDTWLGTAETSSAGLTRAQMEDKLHAFFDILVDRGELDDATDPPERYIVDGLPRPQYLDTHFFVWGQFGKSLDPADADVTPNSAEIVVEIVQPGWRDIPEDGVFPRAIGCGPGAGFTEDSTLGIETQYFVNTRRDANEFLCWFNFVGRSTGTPVTSPVTGVTRFDRVPLTMPDGRTNAQHAAEMAGDGEIAAIAGPDSAITINPYGDENGPCCSPCPPGPTAQPPPANPNAWFTHVDALEDCSTVVNFQETVAAALASPVLGYWLTLVSGASTPSLAQKFSALYSPDAICDAGHCSLTLGCPAGVDATADRIVEVRAEDGQNKLSAPFGVATGAYYTYPQPATTAPVGNPSFDMPTNVGTNFKENWSKYVTVVAPERPANSLGVSVVCAWCAEADCATLPPLIDSATHTVATSAFYYRAPVSPAVLEVSTGIACQAVTFEGALSQVVKGTFPSFVYPTLKNYDIAVDALGEGGAITFVINELASPAGSLAATGFTIRTEDGGEVKLVDAPAGQTQFTYKWLNARGQDTYLLRPRNFDGSETPEPVSSVPARPERYCPRVDVNTGSIVFQPERSRVRVRGTVAEPVNGFVWVTYYFSSDRTKRTDAEWLASGLTKPVGPNRGIVELGEWDVRIRLVGETDPGLPVEPEVQFITVYTGDVECETDAPLIPV